MRGVHGRFASGDRPPPLFCVGGGIGGAPVTGVGSPAGEMLPMIVLVLLFLWAGAWAFRRYSPELEAPERDELPAGERSPAPEPALA